MCSIGSLIAILTSKGVQALVNHPLAASARSDRSIMVRSSHEGERDVGRADVARGDYPRSEEHTSELQSLMRISYAVFCLKKKNNKQLHTLYITTFLTLRRSTISKV